MACRLPPCNPVSFTGFCPVQLYGKAEKPGPQYTAGSKPTLAKPHQKSTLMVLFTHKEQKKITVTSPTMLRKCYSL